MGGRRSGNLGLGRIAVGFRHVETLFREILGMEGGDELVPDVLLVDAVALDDPVALPHSVIGLAAKSVVARLEIVQYLEPVDDDGSGDTDDDEDGVSGNKDDVIKLDDDIVR